MGTGRLPWEIVETLPWSDAEELARHDAGAAAASTTTELVHHLVGASLCRYWAASLDTTTDDAATNDRRRRADVDRALTEARGAGDHHTIAVALLGQLYATWGPPEIEARRAILDELDELRPRLDDRELRVRIVEWLVLDRFDLGDVDGAAQGIESFLTEARGLDSKLFTRREALWRANLAMLEGRIDEAIQINEEAIAATADLAGTPFSFQNVAISMAIAGYFRRTLHDLVGAVRSILASSPRVEINWEVGLTFTLSEVGEFDEARERFDRLATDDFATIPRDLNWLVATQLLGLVAVTLDDRPRAAILLDQLKPFADLDATHGSGYASYGPVGRTVGLLAATTGDVDAAHRRLDGVLAERAPGPWTTLARADRARLLAEHDPVAALADAEQAEAELRRLGLDARADECHGLVVELHLRGAGAPIARLTGTRWTLRHPTGTAEIGDGVGTRLLLPLLQRPGAAFDVLDLDGAIDPALPRASSAESALDDHARSAYRSRLDRLQREETPDEAVLEEIAFLRRELAAGTHVSSSSAEIEKARVRTTTALRRTIATIAETAPALGAHLRDAVVTGRQCGYQPADGVAWRIER